jgi:hypothetical protein
MVYILAMEKSSPIASLHNLVIGTAQWHKIGNYFGFYLFIVYLTSDKWMNMLLYILKRNMVGEDFLLEIIRTQIYIPSDLNLDGCVVHLLA